jgi:hypothetical protein
VQRAREGGILTGQVVDVLGNSETRVGTDDDEVGGDDSERSHPRPTLHQSETNDTFIVSEEQWVKCRV